MEKNCPDCGGLGEEELDGTALELLGDEYLEWIEVIHSIVSSRERHWTILEWWEQPMLWNLAFWFAIGDIGERQEQWRKERRGNS